MDTAYYFDVLPVRPSFEPLESLTSYVTRLAVANGITSVDAMTTLCFPKQDRRISRELADFPPASIGVMGEAEVIPEKALLNMTFFHLGVKFGRSSKPQPLSRFLTGCIARETRYCPSCLAVSHPYYSLLWRFLGVQCCTLHHCKLLDRCGDCGYPLPLFAAPLSFGKCPRCGIDLKLCRAEDASELELSQTLAHQQDLVLLLSPSSGGADHRNIAQSIGSRFKQERRVRGFTALEVADRMGVTLTVVEGIERGSTLRRGAKFQNYVHYARHLGVSLRAIFAALALGNL